MTDVEGLSRDALKARVAIAEAEIVRLQAAKRNALLIADERSKENVALRQENERLRAELAELRAEPATNAEYERKCAEFLRDHEQTREGDNA